MTENVLLMIGLAVWPALALSVYELMNFFCLPLTEQITTMDKLFSVTFLRLQSIHIHPVYMPYICRDIN